MTREEQLNEYLKERNIPVDSLEANSIKEGIDWVDKTMVEKAVEFLKDNLRTVYDDPYDYVMADSIYETVDEFINNFSKAMEE